MQTFSYIDDGNPLHTIDVHSHFPDTLWVVFVHGGAWLSPIVRQF
jgi:hypothetical protein